MRPTTTHSARAQRNHASAIFRRSPWSSSRTGSCRVSTLSAQNQRSTKITSDPSPTTHETLPPLRYFPAAASAEQNSRPPGPAAIHSRVFPASPSSRAISAYHATLAFARGHPYAAFFEFPWTFPTSPRPAVRLQIIALYAEADHPPRIRYTGRSRHRPPEPGRRTTRPRTRRLHPPQ